MSASARVLEKTINASVVVCERLFVLRVKQSPTKDNVTWVRGLLADFINQGGSATLWVILPPKGRPPGGEARTVVNSMFTELGPKINQVAITTKGEGLFAAAQRSVITSIFFFRRSPFEVKVVNTEEDAAAWLAPRLGLDESEILEAARMPVD